MPRKKNIRKSAHYKEIKKFVDESLQGVPFQLKVDSPVEWCQVFLPLIVSCANDGDYEGAQATKDAIIDFLNRFIEDPNEKLTYEVGLKLPDYKPVQINGIICYVNKERPLTGNAEFISVNEK